MTGQHSNQLNYVPTEFSTTCPKLLNLLAFLTVDCSPCFYHFHPISPNSGINGQYGQ